MTQWPLAQLRHIARFEYGDSLASAVRADGDVPVYGSNGRVGWHDRANTRGPTIVIGRKGSYGQVSYSEVPVFAIDTTYYVDASTTANDLRWLYYALSTAELTTLGQDVGVPGLNRDLAYGQRVPLPPVAEQRAIADYLDAETARIDALIAKKQHLTCLLQERRFAAIDDAVTGVDAPSVPVRRLSSRITSGPRGWAEYASDTGTPFIRITNIQRDRIDLDMSDTLLVNAPLSAESNRTRARTGDVLVSITADIGSVGVVSPDLDGSNISQHVALVRPENCEPAWLAYAVRSTPARYQLDSGQYGGTKTQLSLDDISSLRVPYPAIEVQRRRLAELRDALANIDSCTFRLRRQLGFLAEHRQALMAAAVTGELSVPLTT